MTATATELYGKDVLFQDGDVVLGVDGDLRGVDGRACLLQDLETLLTSAPGGLLSSATAGVGLQQFVNCDNLPARRVALTNRIQDCLTDDPRVLGATATVESWTRDTIQTRIQVVPIFDPNPLNLLLTITAAAVTLAEVPHGI